MYHCYILILGLCFSIEGIAANFSEADSLFRRRAEGGETVRKARKLYDTLASNHTGEDRLYAVSQMSRLDLVAGEMQLSRFEVNDRKKIFQNCLNNLKRISPGEIGSQVEEYYAWSLMCIYYWSISADLKERKEKEGEIRILIDQGLKLVTYNNFYLGRLEGGAIGRYSAIIMCHPAFTVLGLSDCSKSLKLGENLTGLDIPRPFQCPYKLCRLHSYSYYENHLILSKINYETDDLSSAEDVSISALENILDNRIDWDLPYDREYETLYFGNQLRQWLIKMSRN